jgi:hypothetical protein
MVAPIVHGPPCVTIGLLLASLGCSSGYHAGGRRLISRLTTSGVSCSRQMRCSANGGIYGREPNYFVFVRTDRRHGEARVFGQTVRAHRLRLGMTQEELSATARVGLRTIRDIETSRTVKPRPGTVRLLADAFGLQGTDRDHFHRSALLDP